MIWRPNKKQEIALKLREVDILFYGGARGGGKTAYLLADFLMGVNEFGERWRGVLFRRTLRELEDVIAQARLMYLGLGAEYNKTEKKFTFKNGAELWTSYLESDSDVEYYQGHNYPWIGFDELGNYASDYCFVFMMMCNRSAYVPQEWVRMRATGNPGGAGHSWLKERFIAGKEPYRVYKESQGVVDGHELFITSCFIPATVNDNTFLVKTNPQYIAKLRAMPERTRKAMLEGSWDLKSGGEFFDQFDHATHVIPPSILKGQWRRFYAMDWGFKSPYAVVKLAVNPDGMIIVYGEIYGQGKDDSGKERPNLGTRETSAEVAAKVASHAAREGVTECVFDYNMNQQTFSNQAAIDAFYDTGLYMHPANKKHEIGWDCLHSALKDRDEFGVPFLRVFSTCKYLIGELERLQCDKNELEEPAPGQSDHAVDALRYGVVSPFYQRKRARLSVVDDRPPRRYNPLEHGYFSKHG